MKKVLAVLFAAALALTMSVSAFADTNLALTATAIGSNPDGENVASRANDGDPATYYGSTANDTTMAEGEYVGVLLDGSYNITSLAISWGGGSPATDGYDIEITTDGTNWTKVNATITREDVDGTHKNDAITLTATATGIRAKTNKAMGKNTLQCWEFEVYGTAAQGGNDNEQPGGGEEGGVASTLAFAVVAMSAAGVAFVSKKKA